MPRKLFMRAKRVSKWDTDAFYNRAGDASYATYSACSRYDMYAFSQRERRER
jgi:hypothetical protein